MPGELEAKTRTHKQTMILFNVLDTVDEVEKIAYPRQTKINQASLGGHNQREENMGNNSPSGGCNNSPQLTT